MMNTLKKGNLIKLQRYREENHSTTVDLRRLATREEYEHGNMTGRAVNEFRYNDAKVNNLHSMLGIIVASGSYECIIYIKKMNLHESHLQKMKLTWLMGSSYIYKLFNTPGYDFFEFSDQRFMIVG